MHPTQKAAEAWEADAIEQCKNDPANAAAGLCPVCMCSAPCICASDRATSEMRQYYEANRRTLLRAEPKGLGSWGKQRDVLMEQLYAIATRDYEVALQKLRTER